MIDFKFQARRSGKTTFLLQKAKEYKNPIALVNNYNTQKYKNQNIKSYSYDRQDFSRIRGRNIDCLLYDDVLPKIEAMEYCDNFKIDLYYRGTNSFPLDIGLKKYLQTYYPEALI